MSDVFKVTVVEYWLFKCWIAPDGTPCPEGTPGAKFVESRRVSKDTTGAQKVTKESGKWYGRLPNDRKPVPLSANKAAARVLLAELLKKVELGRAGISDPFEEHRCRPLLEHLADFRRELQARNRAPSYVADVFARLNALLDGCRFTFMDDLSASRAMDWLADLRQKGRPRVPLESGQEWFTVREAAALLGLKPASVGTAVNRERLEARGQGKARRLPRATVEALQDRLAQGASVRTSNAYLIDLKSFCRWLVRDGRMGSDPLLRLKRADEQVDRRHDRRELEAEELRRLLEVTRASPRPFRGLTGPDRFHLYATACATGFRAAALASLTPESFDLEADSPTVTLAARKNKSRKQKVQPLPPDVAELLRGYLAGRPAGRPVWEGTGTWAKSRKGAEMIRRDLEAAGIPYAVEGPDGPLFADFHALRHNADCRIMPIEPWCSASSRRLLCLLIRPSRR